MEVSQREFGKGITWENDSEFPKIWTIKLKHCLSQQTKGIFLFFFLILLLLYFTLQYCIGFAIHWHESTMGVHAIPNMNPSPTPLLQSHSHQDSMELAQRQKHRSMEQNRKLRDKSTHIGTPYLWQRRQEYTME